MVNNAPTVGRPKTNETALKTVSGKSTRSRNYDPRGSSTDRANRKTYFLTSPNFHRRPGTEGRHVNCTHCGKELSRTTVQADKKDPAGTYRRENVQPACGDCNRRRGNDVTWAHS